MDKNLCSKVLSLGGDIIPLVIPSEQTRGTGLMNPSIFNDNGQLYVNIRHINYTLYHSEGNQLFQNRWGPLAYLHPENDIHLKTNNFFCFLNDNFEITRFNMVNMTLDVSNPMWEFHGLEDARVVKWDDQFYMSGVRRDTTPNGQGRIELSGIEILEKEIKEISRLRTEPPGIPSYCEKNWMPVLDMPYHYVKWCNPTQVVKVDMSTGQCQTTFLSHIIIPNLPDFRGGSQVINWMGLKLAVVHQVNLFRNKLGQKDASYDHRFIIWNNNWDIVHISEPFKFMTGEIEFACGMAFFNDDLLISFGFQDNASYLLKIPKNSIEEIIGFKPNIDQIVRRPKSTSNNSKFKTFPESYVVSFIDSKDRREILEEQFEKYGIKKPIPIISTKESDSKNIVTGKFLDQLTPWHTNVTASHLKAIKQWYNNSKTPYALFLEDDVTLETIDYWNFTWDEFMEGLPSDWDCIQLTCIKENLYDVKLRKREWNDWSVTAYLITREYAKRLIDEYNKDEKFTLEIKDTNLLPITENIIYLLGKTYVIPLFAENPLIKTTYDQEKSNIKKLDKELKLHEESSKFVINWWKSYGNQYNIKTLTNIGYSQLYQDKFVLSLFEKDHKGIYVDIGCQLPDKINNTLLLEENGWSGICLDIEDYNQQWKDRKNSLFVQHDATTCDYKKLFKEQKLPYVIDYLSLDIEGDGSRYKALKKVMESGYEFKVITVEHDAYRGYDLSERQPQRKLLSERGYLLLCSDVYENLPHFPVEDWWVNPKYMDENIYLKYKSSNKSAKEILKNKVL